ncbi:MAG: hypothetical protein ACREOH_09285, partial [Candidatus Entotheonellia bacterium]
IDPQALIPLTGADHGCALASAERLCSRLDAAPAAPHEASYHSRATFLLAIGLPMLLAGRVMGAARQRLLQGSSLL